ncbi:uncharacterized protein LOC135813137 [Sycon ciliatum]|uniref:uncharacterized protein LOC135813137 n=1 Tax=Sycon ciliatum TaxID=27933 RepID=UPI0031F63B20
MGVPLKPTDMLVWFVVLTTAILSTPCLGAELVYLDPKITVYFGDQQPTAELMKRPFPYLPHCSTYHYDRPPNNTGIRKISSTSSILLPTIRKEGDCLGEYCIAYLDTTLKQTLTTGDSGLYECTVGTKKSAQQYNLKVIIPQQLATTVIPTLARVFTGQTQNVSFETIGSVDMDVSCLATMTLPSSRSTITNSAQSGDTRLATTTFFFKSPAQSGRQSLQFSVTCTTTYKNVDCDGPTSEYYVRPMASVGRCKTSAKPLVTSLSVTINDEDECATGLHRCDANATCSNTVGSYTCACNQHFSGNGLNCTAVGCLEPVIWYFPRKLPRSYPARPNEKIHFFCFNGYNLEGSSFLTCQHNYTWDGPVPTCEGNRERLPREAMQAVQRATVDVHIVGLPVDPFSSTYSGYCESWTVTITEVSPSDQTDISTGVQQHTYLLACQLGPHKRAA